MLRQNAWTKKDGWGLCYSGPPGKGERGQDMQEIGMGGRDGLVRMAKLPDDTNGSSSTGTVGLNASQHIYINLISRSGISCRPFRSAHPIAV